MDATIIISYSILLLIQITSLTFIPISLIAEILKKLKLPTRVGILVGSLIIWLFLNFLWIKMNNHSLPLLAFALSWFVKLYKSLKNTNVNPEINSLMLKTEASGIILVMLFVFIFKEFNWY